MKDFRNKQAIDRIQSFIDRLSRKIWEPFHRGEDGFPENTLANQPYKDYKGVDFYKFWEVAAKSSASLQGVLSRNASYLPNEEEFVNAPHGTNLAQENSGWQTFEFDSLINIASSNCIKSVSDATIKTSAFLSTIAGAAANNSNRYLFRGQGNIQYELKPRLGRVLAEKIEKGEAKIPKEYLKVTEVELEDFENFKKAWPDFPKHKLDEVITEEFDEEHIGWWVMMQHFAEAYGNGTRMLDVTSNLLVALFFACVGWNDGLVDDQNDGVLYFFLEGQGSAVDDFSERTLPKHVNLFDAQHDIPHMIFNPPHNERSKAQGGAFVWWPKFWEQPESNVYYLRIPKECKLSIAKELLSFGIGPKEIVRGAEGFQCEKNLKKQIREANI